MMTAKEQGKPLSTGCSWQRSRMTRSEEIAGAVTEGIPNMASSSHDFVFGRHGTPEAERLRQQVGEAGCTHADHLRARARRCKKTVTYGGS